MASFRNKKTDCFGFLFRKYVVAYFLEHKNQRTAIHPPGSLHRNSIYTFSLQHQELLGGKYISTEIEIPDINEQGRIPPPKIVAFYDGNDAMLKREIPKIYFDDALMEKL